MNICALGQDTRGGCEMVSESRRKIRRKLDQIAEKGEGGLGRADVWGT